MEEVLAAPGLLAIALASAVLAAVPEEGRPALATDGTAAHEDVAPPAGAAACMLMPDMTGCARLGPLRNMCM